MFRCLLDTPVLGFHKWQTARTTKTKPKQTKTPNKLKKNPKKSKPKLAPQNTQTSKKKKTQNPINTTLQKNPKPSPKNQKKIKRDKLMHFSAVQVNDLEVSVGVTQHGAKLKCFIIPES